MKVSSIYLGSISLVVSNKSDPYHYPQLGKSHGITVNTLAPGMTYTEMSKPILENDDGTPSEMQMMLRSQLRAEDRIGTTEDMADAALLLVSEKSRWITAQWISVSGGSN